MNLQTMVDTLQEVRVVRGTRGGGGGTCPDGLNAAAQTLEFRHLGSAPAAATSLQGDLGPGHLLWPLSPSLRLDQVARSPQHLGLLGRSPAQADFTADMKTVPLLLCLEALPSGLCLVTHLQWLPRRRHPTPLSLSFLLNQMETRVVTP